ncbi:MAG TPA: 30S ribosomal protein S16 [Candidatus Limnocylindria bacterium]
MAVHIRLRRHGKTKQPTYRLVAADSRAPRNGKFLENLGHYDPRKEPVELVVNVERVKHWFTNGAKPTETARDLLVKAGIPESEVPKVAR